MVGVVDVVSGLSALHCHDTRDWNEQYSDIALHVTDTSQQGRDIPRAVHLRTIQERLLLTHHDSIRICECRKCRIVTSSLYTRESSNSTARITAMVEIKKGTRKKTSYGGSPALNAMIPAITPLHKKQIYS
jgi:hypothetical protein